MKTTIKTILLFTPLITMFSCTGYNIIDSGYDTILDFSNYKCFAWVPTSDTATCLYDNKAFRDALMEDFTAQLRKRKYLSEPDTPDFYIELSISFDNQIRYEDVPVPQFVPYSYHPHTDNFHFTTSAPDSYSQQQYTTRAIHYVQDYVTIHIIDRKTGNLAFSITSEADIDFGNEIPDSIHSITKHLVRKFLSLKKLSNKNHEPG